MRLPRIRPIVSVVGATLVVLVLALYAHHVATKFATFTVDDAAISYAYANNLAHWEGFRLTANASPVEGFSNPLEVLLLVPFAWLGINLDTACKFLNLAAVIGAVLVTAMMAWKRMDPWSRMWLAVPCAFGFLWPTFNHWIVAGLEGGLLCGLQILSIALLVVSPLHRRRDAALGMVAILLVLARPEGVVYGGLAVAFRVLQPGRRFRPAAIFCVGFLFILLVRYALFRQWVANTYYAKITTDAHVAAGLGYVHDFWKANGRAYFLCLLPLFALVARSTWVAALAALAQGVFANGFAILSGGDWMRHWRFMQPLQGPFWALCLLGLLALFARRTGKHPRLSWAGRSVLLLAAILPLAMPGFAEWERRVKSASLERDVDMNRIATVGGLYKRLGDRLDLGRPLLIADVDVGGMSYPPGIDVLDMGGLTDNVFGYSWTRRPTEMVDYFFLERRPDTLHAHGGWVGARPLHAVSPFQHDYRVMGPAFLSQLAVCWLTAIRSDLVDPPAAPVVTAQASLGPIQILGFSAVESAPGLRVLFVHAVQTRPAALPPLHVKDANQHVWPVSWHAGNDVERGPVGTLLLGKLDLPATVLPLHIEGTDLRLTAWPSVEHAPVEVASLTRLPLFRLAGLPSPTCEVDAFLDPRAHAGARARGVALLSQLCGGGLSRADRERLDRSIVAEASKQILSDDRYDAYRVAHALGLPTSTFRRIHIERERARHTYFDEVALAWALTELSPSPLSPEQARAGLGALLVARQYDRLLLIALARGLVRRPEVQDLLCETVTALGLRRDLVPELSCADNLRYPPRALRQGFENASDPLLHFDKISRPWLVSRPPAPSIGGQGRSFLYIPPCAKEPCGEVTWGPLSWSGHRFGVLLAGPGKGASVVVESRDGDRWSEIGRATQPADPMVLTPQMIRLPAHGTQEVRVRIANQSVQDPMMVDALTFLDLGD